MCYYGTTTSRNAPSPWRATKHQQIFPVRDSVYLRDAESAELGMTRTPSSIRSNNVIPGLRHRRIFSSESPPQHKRSQADIFSSTVRLVESRTPPFVEGTHKTVAQLRLYEQQYGGCYKQMLNVELVRNSTTFPRITQQQQTFLGEESGVGFHNTCLLHYMVSKCAGPLPLFALLACM